MSDLLSFAQLASDTGTSDVSGVINEVISKRVELAARPKRVFRDLITVNTDLLNKSGDVVHIPLRETLTASAIAEHGTVSPSTFTYGTCLTLTPSEFATGVAISQQSIERGVVNILEGVAQEIGEGLAQCEDIEVRTALNTGTIAIYGGDATGTADIEVGDRLTPELFSRAILRVRESDYEPTDCVIGPSQQYSLSTYPQFSNAAMWGGTDVLKTGYVPQYMGVKIHTSTNIEKLDGGLGTNVSYSVCYMFNGKRACAIGLKSNPQIRREYKVLERKHVIVGSMDFDVGLLNSDALVKIVVSND